MLAWSVGVSIMVMGVGLLRREDTPTGWVVWTAGAMMLLTRGLVNAMT